MSDPDFARLLSTKVDDVKEPVPLQAGTYYGICRGFKFDKSKEKQTPYVRFTFGLIGAGDDVDQEYLRQNDIDISKKEMNVDFYLTETSLFRLKNFLESIPSISTKGRSLNEVIPDTQNAQVILSVAQQPNRNDPTKIFNVVNDVKGVDA